MYEIYFHNYIQFYLDLHIFWAPFLMLQFFLWNFGHSAYNKKKEAT